MATFNDDFNRPNSTDLGASWLEVSGDWSINGSQLSPGSASGTIIARAATAMDSNDHYVQVTITTTTAASHGVWCRGNPTGGLVSGYLLRNDGTTWTLFSVVGSSFTDIGSYAASAVAGDVVRLSAVGSSIKGTINSVELITVTNSAVPTGTSVGLRSESTAAIRFDDFTAGDISSGTSLALTPAPSTATAQPLTGTKTASAAPSTDVATAQPLTGGKAAALSPAPTSTDAQIATGAKSVPLAPAATIGEALTVSGQKRAVLTPASERSIAVGSPAPMIGVTLRPADRLTPSTDGPVLGASTSGPVLAATSTSGG